MQLGFMRIFCGLAIAVLLVRLIAPVVQEWQWKWGTIYAERADARSEIEQQIAKVSVEELVSSPAGALIAATVCEDKRLIRRAQKVWLADVKRGPKGGEHELAAKVAAEVLQAGVIDLRIRMILTKDCAASVRYAAGTVSQYER